MQISKNTVQSNKSKDLIIWDWNGTLLNDTHLCYDIINQLLIDRGKPALPIDEHRMIFDFPVRQFYERAGFDFENESFELVSTEFMECYYKGVSKCKLHDGAVEVLRKYDSSEFDQIILSASEQSDLNGALSQFGVNRYFKIALGIDTIHAVGKLEIAKRWMEQNRESYHNIVLVGDTAHDAEVARELNISSLLVSHGHHHPDRLRNQGFEVVSDFVILEKSLVKRLSITK